MAAQRIGGSSPSRNARLFLVSGVAALMVVYVNVKSSAMAISWKVDSARTQIIPQQPQQALSEAKIVEAAAATNDNEKEALHDIPKRKCTGICDCLKDLMFEDVSSLPSTASLWRRFAPKVLEASSDPGELLENVTSATYQGWVKHLFSLVTVSRLDQSFERFPRYAESLNALLSMAQARLDITTAGGTAFEPIKVAVFGGSLTAGHGCLENPLGMKSESFLKRQLPCAWPARVQTILDAFIPGLFNITNMAMAATTSDVGATVVDYQLWPPELHPNGPDVIIASFAINDALADLNQTDIYQNMQQLVTSIQKEQNCRKDRLPLLIYVDDFIAWPGSVQKWLDFHHDLHELAEWHGFGFISYANAFRDVVLADTENENTFKGEWVYRKRKKVKWEPNPHPGLSFHLIMSWVMTYNLLGLGFHICDGQSSDNLTINDPQYPVGSIPSIPRPHLDESLKTEDVSSRWKEIEESERHRCNSVQTGARCGLVWVANRVSQFSTADKIEQFLQQYLTTNSGWKGAGQSYTSKHGWVAQHENATFTMSIPNISTDVRFVTILALKSYGPDWEESRMRVRLNSTEVIMEGFHNSRTSVIIPHKFELQPPVKKGDSFQVSFDLIGGSNYKITGMAFCSS